MCNTHTCTFFNTKMVFNSKKRGCCQNSQQAQTQFNGEHGDKKGAQCKRFPILNCVIKLQKDKYHKTIKQTWREHKHICLYMYVCLFFSQVFNALVFVAELLIYQAICENFIQFVVFQTKSVRKRFWIILETMFDVKQIPWSGEFLFFLSENKQRYISS